MAKIVCIKCGSDKGFIENATRPEWVYRDITLGIDSNGNVDVVQVDRWEDDYGCVGAEEFEYYECRACEYRVHEDIQHLIEIKPTHISERWAHGPEQGQLIKDD